MTEESKLPLEDIKILEFGRVVAGPLTTTMLADYGATVIKVESIKAIDSMRIAPPFKDNIPGPERSGYFAKFNTNKHSMGINLLKPEGLDIFMELVKWCDVLLDSNAPGVANKFGVVYDDLLKINPQLIMIHTSQLGQKGPHAKFKAYGAQSTALAGYYEFAAYEDGVPVGPFGAFTDVITYQQVATAILAALIYRDQTKKGVYFDHSQTEAALVFLAPALLDWTVNHHLTPKMGNHHPNASPHNIYRCSGEDNWCAIAVFDDETWQRLCTAMCDIDALRQGKFDTLLKRKKHEDELDILIQSWTISRTPKQVMYDLQAHGVPASIVANGKDLANDPQLKYRQYYVPMEHPEIGTHYYEMPPHRFSKTPAKLNRPAPLLGEDNFLAHPGYAYLKVERMWTIRFSFRLDANQNEKENRHVHKPIVPCFRPSRLRLRQHPVP